MWRGLAWRVGLLGAALLCVAAVKRDEEVLLLPSAAWPSAEGNGWEVELQGCVWELEPRRWSLAAAKAALGLGGVELSEGEQLLLAGRMRRLLADRESRKSVAVRLSGHTLRMRPRGESGGVGGRFRLRSLGPQAAGSLLEAQVQLPRGDSRRFSADVFLVGAEGLTVVSDIDDTIKVSEVRDRSALLRNTFLRPFEPVPGMAGVYGGWSREPRVAIHYLSGSPVALGPALMDFLKAGGFPAGPMHLREFAWTRSGVLGLLASPRAHKEAVLGQLFERWPRRRFVLVGDSGEEDPEIYAAMARRHPGRVAGIGIRDVTGEAQGAARYAECFAGLAAGQAVVFREPAELDAAMGRWITRGSR